MYREGNDNDSKMYLNRIRNKNFSILLNFDGVDFKMDFEIHERGYILIKICGITISLRNLNIEINNDNFHFSISSSSSLKLFYH